MDLPPVGDPSEIDALYRRHPEVHPYGLADLDEPLWSRSTLRPARSAPASS